MIDRKIITSFIHPPIPFRGCDWQAHWDDEGEEAGNYGYGKTEADAINDLKQATEDAA
jgi:hypothetical protein